MKFIYLIQSLEDGYYKIGISKNPNNRIKNLQTGNSSKLKLVEIYQSEYADKIESCLHRRYSHASKEGEWFDLNINDVANFIVDCKKIEENFIFLKNRENYFI